MFFHAFSLDWGGADVDVTDAPGIARVDPGGPGAESRAVLDTLADEPMWSAVYHLFLSAGLRQGELRALVWSDVQLDQRQLLIRRTLTLDAEGHTVVGVNTKTEKPRAVALPPRALAALTRWQEAQEVRSIRPDTDFVFSVRAGHPLPNTRLQTKHQQIIAATGVPPIRSERSSEPRRWMDGAGEYTPVPGGVVPRRFEPGD